MTKKIHSVLVATFLINCAYPAALTLQPSDNAFPYQYPLPTHTYHRYCRNIYSQNGEDGILEQLLKELEIEGGTFCEFGAWDGISGSNTYNLILNHQFTGMAIEIDPQRCRMCAKNYKSFPHVQVFQGAVLYNHPHFDLNAWLKKGNMPIDLDVLSIDIDGDDYYVWQNLTDYTPKIVILEVNSYRDPVFDELPGVPSSEYNIDPLRLWHPGRIAVGCSFISAVKLGLEKGYIPVAFTGNLTFVRQDLAPRLKEFPILVSDNPYDYVTLYGPLSLWGNQWYTNTGLILNTAIRDYYLEFKEKHIDLDWLNARMGQILQQGAYP